MIYFEGKHAIINYHENKKLVEVAWKDAYSNEEEYHVILTKALVAVKQYDVKYWLSDVTQKKVFLDDERKWLETFIIPNACKNGVKKVAFILNKNVYNMYTHSEKQRDYEANTVKIQIFENRENAITWLDQLNSEKIQK